MEYINCWESKFQPCEYSDKLIFLLESLNKWVAEPVDINEVKKACHVAREYHGSQLRKSGEPYYSHPLEVGCLFSRYAGIENHKYYTTDLVITAILHDCLEDTKLTKDMIEAIFGDIVANGVQDLTRIKDGIKITAADSVDLLVSQHKEGVLLIKIFDRLHNARTINFMPPHKVVAILQETLRKFLFSSIYTETAAIEKELIEISRRYLPKPQKNLGKLTSQGTYRLPSLD
jgi:(p)ppGpp synthase/HD superfamily hydrolase